MGGAWPQPQLLDSPVTGYSFQLEMTQNSRSFSAFPVRLPRSKNESAWIIRLFLDFGISFGRFSLKTV